MELDGKTIDVVWNGMTLTDEVTSAMELLQRLLQQRPGGGAARRCG